MDQAQQEGITITELKGSNNNTKKKMNSNSSVVSQDMENFSQLSRLLEEECLLEEASVDKQSSTSSLNNKRSNLFIPSLVWREKVSQWCYDVVDHLQESRDTVYIAMNILDRFIQLQQTNTNERTYEAAAMTSLFIAVRIAGEKSLDVVDLVRMSRLGIRIQEIIDIGKELTQSLRWEKRLVTPREFVSAFLRCLPSTTSSLPESIHETAIFHTQLAVCDPYFRTVRASDIALASVLNLLDAEQATRLQTIVAKGQEEDDRLQQYQVRLSALVRHQCHDASAASGGVHIIPNDDDDDQDKEEEQPSKTSPTPFLRRCNTRLVSRDKLAHTSSPIRHKKTTARPLIDQKRKRSVSPTPPESKRQRR